VLETAPAISFPSMNDLRPYGDEFRGAGLSTAYETSATSKRRGVRLRLFPVFIVCTLFSAASIAAPQSRANSSPIHHATMGAGVHVVVDNQVRTATHSGAVTHPCVIGHNRMFDGPHSGQSAVKFCSEPVSQFRDVSLFFPPEKSSGVFFRATFSGYFSFFRFTLRGSIEPPTSYSTSLSDYFLP